MKIKNIFFLLFVSIITYNCNKKEIILLEDTDDNIYASVSPANFPPFLDDIDNPLTKNGILLGKKLFKDPILSSNNKVSCTTCHISSLGFADGKDLTNSGVSGKKLLRTSPTLINLAWNRNGFFWDGGSKNLESQALGPITNHNEMDQNLHLMVKKLNANNEYITLFKKAFDDTITTSNVLKALAQFQRTLVSANSKYDKFIRNEFGGNFSEEEKKGYRLFKNKCSSCHTEPLFTDNKYHNNGIDSSFTDSTHENLFKGRYRITFDKKDLGAYRTPTLRNIMQTAPYMHDGRFSDIKSVLTHYQLNVKKSKSLDPILINKDYLGIKLTEEDKKLIIKFLETLTDEEFLNQDS